MIVVAKLTCPGCGHSGSAEWRAYRPKLSRELTAVRGRFVASGALRASTFLCEGCRCIAHASEDLAVAARA